MITTCMDSITITDPQSGSNAKLLPGFGWNCYRFQAMFDGNPLDVLWSHPNFTSGNEPPSFSGIPILFPFGGRIEGAMYTFEGREYRLEFGDDMGNAIHGFVLKRPWRVTAQSATQASAEFQASIDDPTLLEQWPADFYIAVEYSIRGNTLTSRYRIQNPSDQPLPFGLGVHAYFRLPFGSRGAAKDCAVKVPIGKKWELVDLRPTGNRIDSDEIIPLQSGLVLGDREFDDVYGDLQSVDGKCTTSIYDPANQRTLTQRFDDSMIHCIVYTPPHREAICMEPHTSLPDPFRLEANGVETGFRSLMPGGSYETTVELQMD